MHCCDCLVNSTHFSSTLNEFSDFCRLVFLQGNELQIRQSDLYLREGEELSFYEIILRARQRREIVIGYRLATAERAVINPPSKSNRQRWSVKDVFVVIAEKEWIISRIIHVEKERLGISSKMRDRFRWWFCRYLMKKHFHKLVIIFRKGWELRVLLGFLNQKSTLNFCVQMDASDPD